MKSREQRPVHRAFVFGGILVACHESDGAGEGTMGQGNSRVCGRSDSGGDAGDDLVTHAGDAKSFRFLASSTENKRIAPLEADDAPAALGGADHPVLDSWTPVGVAVGKLGDAYQFRARASEIEETRRHQAVVENQICPSQALNRAQGEQLWITGPGADDVNERIVSGLVLRPGRR
jgi:hypothetical protein